MSTQAVSELRLRMIEDMKARQPCRHPKTCTRAESLFLDN